MSDQRIRLIRPYIQYGQVEDDFRAVFESGQFTKGPWVDRLRSLLTEYTGARHAFLATSATTALSVALRAVGVRVGDEVIVADFSFPASANVIEDLNAIPVFGDVDGQTFTMTPDEVERKLTPRTRAVMFVDALGNPAGVHDVRAVCRAAGVPLIEDAACGIGSSERGSKVGAIADLSCFSFHPRKLLTTGEGGAITTIDDRYGAFFEVKLNHGAVVRDGRLEFVDYGYNYRLPELQCVMGVKQLEVIDQIVVERLATRAEYVQRLAPLGYRVQHVPDSVVHNVQSMVFVVPGEGRRDKLISHLASRGIESTIGTYCLSGTEYYRSRYHNVQPNARRLFESTITLPCYRDVDVERVCDGVEDYERTHKSR